VSNFDTDDLDEAQAAAKAVAGSGAMACNQVLYHLGERYIERAVIPWCETHGVAVTGYSPFGHDDFPSARSAGGRVLAEIAREYAATPRQITPRQVALAFLVRQPGMFTIPKAGTVVHVEENAGAGDLELTADEIARIAAAFPLGRPQRALPML
jgi:diketogulonate reductase-like aldo/keto reductase